MIKKYKIWQQVGVFTNFYWFCHVTKHPSYILKHLKDKKLWSVHIYYMVMTSFSFSNCTEELSFASFFYTEFENSNDVIPM